MLFFYVIKKRTKIVYICICLIYIKKQGKGKATLVMRWIRICLSLQGTWVQILVWEDFTCLGETKSGVPQLLSPSSRVHEPQ